MHIPVFGNGDVDTPQKALEMKKRYGVDGIMIGRASIGYPWIFNEIKHYLKTGEILDPPTMSERIQAARQHLNHSVEWKNPGLGVLEMRRHYNNYFKGIAHFKPYRMRLVTTDDYEGVLQVLSEIEREFGDYVFAESG